MKTTSLAAFAAMFLLGLTTSAKADFPTFYSDSGDFHAAGTILESTDFDAYGPDYTILNTTESFGSMTLKGDPLVVLGVDTGYNPVRNLIASDDPSKSTDGEIAPTGFNMLAFKMANIRGYGGQVYVELLTNLTSYGYGLYPQPAPEAVSFYGFVVPEGEYFLGFKMNRTNIGSNYEETGISQAFALTDIELGKTAVVPEPGSWALMIIGFGAAGAVLRTRRRMAPSAA